MSYKAYAGAGTVYMAPVDENGTKTGNFRQVGDAYPLSVEVKTDQIKKKSRMVERAGQVIAARSKISDDGITGNLTLHEWNAANLAWALSGTAVALSAAGATISDEVVTAPAAGEFIQLGGATPRRNISAVGVTTSPAGTTYVEGTDYTIDSTLGFLTIVDGGDITEADELLVGYTYAAETGYRVDIGSNVTLRVAIQAHLYDEYRGKHYTLELDSVVLNASQEINFISEDDSTGELLQFGLTMETLSGKSSPGRVDGIPM
jgi:hypothetical protein